MIVIIQTVIISLMPLIIIQRDQQNASNEKYNIGTVR